MSGPIDPTQLAVAAGRLYQVITKDTALQFAPQEARAWIAFTEAIGESVEEVYVAESIDPVRLNL